MGGGSFPVKGVMPYDSIREFDFDDLFCNVNRSDTVATKKITTP